MGDRGGIRSQRASLSMCYERPDINYLGLYPAAFFVYQATEREELIMAKESAKQNETNELTANDILSAFKSMDAAQIKKICAEGVKDVQKKAARDKFDVIEDVLLSNSEFMLILGADQNSKPVIRFAFEELFNTAIIKSADGKDLSCVEFVKTMCNAKVKDEDDRKAKRRKNYAEKKNNSKPSKSNDAGTDTTSNYSGMTLDDVVQMFMTEHPDIDKETASNLIHRSYDAGHRTVDKLMENAHEMYTTT